MKRTLDSLMAACVLASVAQAQFCDVERDLTGVEATSILKIDESTDLAPDLFDAGSIQSEFRFRDLSPAGAFHHGLAIGTGPTSGHGHPLEGFGREQTSIFEFSLSEPTESDIISTWLDETKTGFQFRAMLEALDADTGSDSLSKDQEVDSDGVNRTLPEATTFGLIGTMMLLGLVVVRNLPRAKQ